MNRKHDPLRESVRDKKMEIFSLSFLVWMWSDQSILSSSQQTFHTDILPDPFLYIGRTGWIYWNVPSYKFGPPANKHVFITIPDWILTCWIVLSDKYEYNTNQTQQEGKVALRTKGGTRFSFDPSFKGRHSGVWW